VLGRVPDSSSERELIRKILLASSPRGEVRWHEELIGRTKISDRHSGKETGEVKQEPRTSRNKNPRLKGEEGKEEALCRRWR
jgi:hypothetical protein